jgi:hypothetical protein
METRLIALPARPAAATERGAIVALTSIKVVDFARVAGKPKKPNVLPSPVDVPKHTKYGNYAQWAAVGVAVFLGALNVYLFVSFHNEGKAGNASDEHIGKVIRDELKPLSNTLETKFGDINKQLSDLSGRVGHVQGQVDELNDRANKLKVAQDGLSKRMNGQEAIVRLVDPNRILATIQAEIKAAAAQKRELPAADLADYRNALRILPASAANYWTTVAAIINYQSLINQLSGEAPDPTKVARNCLATGSMSYNNVFSGGELSDCVVELERNVFHNVVFKDSVIRYRGGIVHLENVRFVNCRFVLDLPERQQASPAGAQLLMALLDAPNQKDVQVQR